MRTSSALVTAASVAASGLLLAGCTSLGSTVSTSAANTPAAGGTAKSGSGAKGSAAGGSKGGSASSSKPAGLGDTIDVTDDSGDKLAVTLVKVDGKAQATDGFSTPPSGDAYYAAQVQIKNLGSAAWSDAPSNCMVVVDGKGQQFQTDIVQSISSGPLMGDTVNLAAGATTLGWLVFDVPTGDKVTEVQFTPESGMGDDTAQWSVS